MTPPELEITHDPGTVWRIGFAPDPWEWSDWKYTQDDGRFGGRWDDQLGQFRTTYAAESLFACLVELLAKLSPSPGLDDIVMAIDDPDDQASTYAEYPPARSTSVGLNDVALGKRCCVVDSASSPTRRASRRSDHTFASPTSG